MEGVIAIANPLHLGTNLVSAIRQFELPAVVIGSEPATKGYASVVTDNFAGGRAAFEHLHSLGHRRIAVIKGPRAMSDSAPRWEGITEGARLHGITLDTKIMAAIDGRNSNYEQGYELTEGLLKAKQGFSALITFDDLTAFAAIGALSNAA